MESLKEKRGDPHIRHLSANKSPSKVPKLQCEKILNWVFCLSHFLKISSLKSVLIQTSAPSCTVPNTELLLRVFVDVGAEVVRPPHCRVAAFVTLLGCVGAHVTPINQTCAFTWWWWSQLCRLNLPWRCPNNIIITMHGLNNIILHVRRPTVQQFITTTYT